MVYAVTPWATARMEAEHLVAWASRRAEPRAGSRMPTSKAMMAITTSSSIRVKARPAPRPYVILHLVGSCSARSALARASGGQL